VLRSPTFRTLWLVSMFSNMGGLLHETAAVWTMTSLSPNPLWVSLMQSALSLPLFLLGLPAGALADLTSPRRVLLRSEAFLAAVAFGLAALAFAGGLTGPSLLTLTLVLGVGIAFSMPSWQALLPDLVSKQDLPNAVALNGLALNLSRAIGPAAGGLLLAWAGPAACFAFNGFTFVVVAVVLLRQRLPVKPAPRLPERYFSAMVAGARYVRHAPLLRLVLLRMVGFVLPATGAIALFPLLARRDWGLGAAGFGLHMGAYGLGAVLAAATIPRLRRNASLRAILALGAASFAVFGLILVWGPSGPGLIAVMPLGGAGWMWSISTLNASAQAAAAAWVRGRALAFNLLCFQGSIALGALLWGMVATWFDVQVAVTVAMLGLTAATAVLHRRDLDGLRNLDLAPVSGWSGLAETGLTTAPAAPTVVTIDYRIDAAETDAFLAATRGLALARRRTGATDWELVRDGRDPTRFQERFRTASWAEHLRQHARFSRSDEAHRQAVFRFHRDAIPPVVTHWIEAAPHGSELHFIH
jgi:MFS family permease